MKHTLILLLAFGLFATTADAQCRSFTKKNCLSSLDGYIQNDNYNSAILIPGDEAELMLTFLAGQDYRLIVCSHPVLGEVAYEINDASGKRLFDSRKNEPDVTPWISKSKPPSNCKFTCRYLRASQPSCTKAASRCWWDPRVDSVHF